MGSEMVEAAYAPFVASLLAGGFEVPTDGGWPAELVAAHVVLNNDLIAETAEKVAAGEEVSYDNLKAVDEEELARYIEGVGGLSGLAGEVERSAARLGRSLDALDEEKAQTSVHVVIRDGGQVVVDRPMPIGGFIEGNASFHLDLHHDQLRALQPLRTADPPADFDTYELVLLLRVAEPPELDEAASDLLQSQHLGFFAKMREGGYMTVAGPIVGGDEIAGISIYRVGSIEKARALAEDDPAVRAGRHAIRVMKWYTEKGAVAFPLSSPDHDS
ncbi:MAG: YciI family protein [Acidimicrobiales bacterium]